ncbi:MAG: phosphoadenosine phosphosulfate reductase [Phycisphaeraceae bacterium]|nr:phosphoadenosine phosphosulfate reductase [Phycisphaeraceae bacterium]
MLDCFLGQREPRPVVRPSALKLKNVVETGQQLLHDASAQAIVTWARETFSDGLVMSTSFGSQSAVMLHLITSIAPDLPVIWIDTGFNFPETYRFADELTKRFKLNLKIYQAEESPARMVALRGNLWEQGREGLDEYDRIRKVEPMRRAFEELGVRAWLTGPRREQTQFRRTLNVVEPFDGVCKVHPVLGWTSRQVHAFMKQHDLPYHPLVAEGYLSIGDWHSTTTTDGRGGDRDGRFHGLKQECGLHIPQSQAENESRESSGL